MVTQRNVTNAGGAAPGAAAGPVVRPSSCPTESGVAARLEDFKAVPSHAIILCVIYPVLDCAGAASCTVIPVLPLLFPLARALPARPFAALGLYEMSRRRENRQPASAGREEVSVAVVRRDARARHLAAGAVRTWIATEQAIYNAVFRV